MRLLIVEDEVDLADVLAKGLRRAGFAVDVAADATTAHERLAETDYDLVSLDVNLPDGDGWAVLDDTRARQPAARVLMLTGRDALSDRVRGLDGGADDYLVKPFEPAELHARIRALLRRESPGTGSVIDVADMKIDRAALRVWRHEAEISLTPKEFGVLAYLASRPGAVVSAEELLAHVWDENLDPFSSIVKVTVSTLRRKLGAPSPIETVRGAGYRLIEA